MVLHFISCAEFEITPAAESKLVVEGWIDSGDYPMVFLTRSLPVSTKAEDIPDFSQLVERWAKVTVSDGDTTVILTGIYDKKYFPPFFYTTSYMKGEVGKTYVLDVETAKEHVTSATTIPPAAYVDSLIVEKDQHNDTLYAVSAYVSRQSSDYFHFFVKNYTQQDCCFMSSFLGAFSCNELPVGESRRFNVNNHRRVFFTKEDYTTAFPHGSLLQIKLSAMDREAYDFWQAYERMLSLSRNPIFPSDENLPTNIKGGYGYWIGYGSSVYNISIPQ